MTRTALKNPAPAPAPAPNKIPAKVIFQGQVALEKIDVVSNIRKTFNPVKMAELVDSVKSHGVNQPILLRPSKKEGRYELVAGERRLRASRTAGLAQIPAIVKDLSAQEASEDQAIENLQREDLPPIEEARGFKVLLETGRYDVKHLAKVVDKSEAYVYRAVRLNELPKDAQDKINAGEWHVAVGHQLLRVPKEKMAEAIKLAHRSDTIVELRDQIERMLGRSLNNAAFPTATPYAGKPACSGCPFNSENQALLFDDVKKGMCTNVPCYDVKQSSWADAASKERADKLGLKSLGARKSDYGQGIEGFKNARVVNQNDQAALIKLHPEKFAVAAVCDRYGDGKPEAKIVCIDAGILPRERYQASAQEQASRKKQLARQRHDAAVDVLAYKDVMSKMTIPLTREAMATIVHGLDKSYLPRGIWDAVGMPKKGNSSFEPGELLKTLNLPQLTAVAFCLAAGSFKDYNGKYDPSYAAAGVDLKPILARAEKKVSADEAAAKKAKKK